MNLERWAKNTETPWKSRGFKVCSTSWSNDVIMLQKSNPRKVQNEAFLYLLFSEIVFVGTLIHPIKTGSKSLQLWSAFHINSSPWSPPFRHRHAIACLLYPWHTLPLAVSLRCLYGFLPRMPLVSAWQRLSSFCLFVVSFPHLPFAHYLPYQYERIGLLSEPTYIINYRPVFCYAVYTFCAINKKF